MKKWLNRFFLTLLYVLPAVVFFTNFPLIRLGEDSSMYYEISLPMIWLAIFDLLNLTRIGEIWAFCKKHPRLLLPAVAVLLYIVLSCFWSANFLRGALTAGLVLAIAFAILSFFSHSLYATSRKRILSVLLASSTAVSIFCLLQCFLDVFDIQETLLCPGCHYQTIGFPHSNGFAIEPQFMGNLLIAPSLITLDIIYKKLRTKKGKRKLPALLCLAVLQITALFVTFSRGAIFAFVLGVIIMTIYRALKRFNLRAFCYVSISVFAFLFGLLLQGLWAEISPTNENFAQGISRSLNHLSLGVIPLIDSSSKPEPNTAVATETTEEESAFDGYIEESTTIRLSLNEAALKTWSQNPRTVFFGVGLGGAGRAMSQHLGTNEKEIVQNEYISLLLELGIVGCSLILFTAFIAFRFFGRRLRVVFFAIIFAYLFSLLFFSGITNVWHIYLLAPVLLPILAI